MKLLHIHLYRHVGSKGANAYYECRLCLKRKVATGHGYSPVDQDWLDGRKTWHAPPPSPPPKPGPEKRTAA